MSENFPTVLPERFRQNAFRRGVGRGEKWLRDLPALIGELKADWNLRRVDGPFPNLSYHYVAPCLLADGGEAVLKIGLPEEETDLLTGAEFLRSSDGCGAVRLLRADDERTALLMERVSPGRDLKEVFAGDEPKALSAAIALFQKLPRSLPPKNFSFPSLERWFGDLEKARNTIFPREAVKKARRIFDELCADPDPLYLLHGDLHHENILSAGNGEFLAIDPKGVIGKRGYEAAVFLNNHADWILDAPDHPLQLKAAVERFSKTFEMEPPTLKKWALIQQILAAWWSFEDREENWRSQMERAEIWE